MADNPSERLLGVIDSLDGLARSCTPAEAAEVLRSGGASRLVIAPWFLAHGRITDRVAAFARSERIPMSSPLGAHRQVAETVLDRFDSVVPERVAA